MHNTKEDCRAKLQSVAMQAKEGVEYLRAVLGEEGFGKLNGKVDKHRAEGHEVDQEILGLLEAKNTLREALGCFERAHIILKPYARKLVSE